MAATPHGVGFRWGLDATCAAFGTYAIQKYTLNNKGEKKLLKNSVGETVGYVGYDIMKEVNFEYICTNSSATLSASITKPTLFSTASVVSSQDADVAGTNWICEDVTEDATCDDFTKVNVKFVQYPLITS